MGVGNLPQMSRQRAQAAHCEALADARDIAAIAPVGVVPRRGNHKFGLKPMGQRAQDRIKCLQKARFADIGRQRDIYGIACTLTFANLVDCSCKWISGRLMRRKVKHMREW